MSFWVVVILSIGLRLFHLGTESLWVDEGYSLRDATRMSNWSLIRALYFIMLNLWMRLGHSEAWLRLLAVIFGVAAVVMIYIVARQMFGHRAAIYSSLLMAISPLHINHSQEIRMYSLATFLVLTEMHFFIRYIKAGKLRDLGGFVVFAILSFLAFPMTPFMMVALGLFLLLRFNEMRSKAILWLTGQLLVGIAMVPLIGKLGQGIRGFQNGWSWGMAKPGIQSILQATRDFNLWQIPEQHKLAVLAGDIYGVLVLALIGVGIGYTYKKAKWQTTLAVLWLIVPILLMVLVSHVLVNVWMVRYMIYASPAYYILTALGLASFKDRRILGLVIVGVMLLPVVRLGVYYGKPHRPEWRRAVAYMDQRIAKGDAVVTYSTGNKIIIDYYSSRPIPYVNVVAKDITRSTASGWDDRKVASKMKAIPKDRKRVWFVFSQSEDAIGNSMRGYVERHCKVLDTQIYNRITIYLVSWPETNQGAKKVGAS